MIIDSSGVKADKSWVLKLQRVSSRAHYQQVCRFSGAWGFQLQHCCSLDVSSAAQNADHQCLFCWLELHFFYKISIFRSFLELLEWEYFHKFRLKMDRKNLDWSPFSLTNWQETLNSSSTLSFGKLEQKMEIQSCAGGQTPECSGLRNTDHKRNLQGVRDKNKRLRKTKELGDWTRVWGLLMGRWGLSTSQWSSESLRRQFLQIILTSWPTDPSRSDSICCTFFFVSRQSKKKWQNVRLSIKSRQLFGVFVEQFSFSLLIIRI